MRKKKSSERQIYRSKQNTDTALLIQRLDESNAEH